MRTHGFRKRMRTRAGREVTSPPSPQGAPTAHRVRGQEVGALIAAGPAGSAERRRERFPRSVRVRRRAEYLTIQNQGRRMSGTHLMLFSRAGSGRIGVTVSRKVGVAVVRNRVKRWIRECFRRQRSAFPQPARLGGRRAAGRRGRRARRGLSRAVGAGQASGRIMSWVLLALVRLYRARVVAGAARAGRAALPVRADVFGLRRGGRARARRRAWNVAGGAQVAALPSVRARGIRPGA